MTAGMRAKGLQEAIDGFETFKKELPDEVGKGVEKSSRHLFRTTQVQVPKKTTRLAESAQFVEHDTSGPKRSRGVRYGEPGEGEGVLDYAAAVHEILTATHAPPTKAKYVEGPLVEGIPEYKRFLGESCDHAVKKAFR